MKLFIAILLMGVSFSSAAQQTSCGVECEYYLPLPPVVTSPVVTPAVQTSTQTVQPTVTPQVHQSIQSSQISAANSVYRGTTMNQVFNASAAAGQPKPTAPACK